MWPTRLQDLISKQLQPKSYAKLSGLGKPKVQTTLHGNQEARSVLTVKFFPGAVKAGGKRRATLGQPFPTEVGTKRAA